jgi:hypothetical protein
MRKGQVVQNMGTFAPEPLDAVYRQLTWAIPSYNFGAQLYFPGQNLSAGPAEKFLRMFWEWLAEAQIRLPFPDVAFLLERSDCYMMIRAIEQDGFIVLLPFGRPKPGAARDVFLIER